LGGNVTINKTLVFYFINLYLLGNNGLAFLKSISGGDDFYDASSGGLTWTIQ
jgi:hypothetical protein